MAFTFHENSLFASDKIVTENQSSRYLANHVSQQPFYVSRLKYNQSSRKYLIPLLYQIPKFSPSHGHTFSKYNTLK